MDEWVRLYTDRANKNYKVFPAPKERFPDPIWPELKPAKIFRLAFRDKGRMIDSNSHPLFLKWAARDKIQVTSLRCRSTSFGLRTSNGFQSSANVPTSSVM